MSEPRGQLSELFPLTQGVSDPGEALEDSTNKMWCSYTKEASEYDKRTTDVWKEDAIVFLIFACLFSIVISIFLMESYKALSKGTYLRPQALSSPAPTASIIWVNTLWLLSLVCSLTSALSATLMHQWARRYTELPHISSSPKDRARVRSFLFLGTLKYHIRLASEITPTLFHLSMSLFFVGLVIFFYDISKTVAILVSIFVGISGMAYFSLTVLPCIYHDCPYGTPMTNLLYLEATSYLIVPYNPGEVKSWRQLKLTEWLEGTENFLNQRVKCLKDGFWKSIVRGALDAPVFVDLQGLTWLLTLPPLAEKSKIEDFVANAPGDTIIRLMNGPIESGNGVFHDHLLTLFRSCTSGTVELDKDVRRRRLLVCLDAIHRIVKAFTTPHGAFPSESVLRDVRINFASIGIMRALWVNDDPSIRIVSRSTCALLARRLVRNRPLEESELAWLQDVMGLPSNTIFNSLDNLAKVDAMNLDSFVYGILSHQTDDLTVKPATLFMETFAILTGAGSEVAFRRDVLEEGLSFLMRRAEGQDSHLQEVAVKLRKIYATTIPSIALEPQTSSDANLHGIGRGTMH